MTTTYDALKAMLLRESDLDYLEASLRLWQAQMQEAADMVVFLSQHIDEVRKAGESDAALGSERCTCGQGHYAWDCPAPVMMTAGDDDAA